MTHIFFIRMRRFIPLILALIIALIIVLHPVFDYDMYWHLANGREMIHSGRIISEEVFSFTHYGEKFENHEWLAQIIFYLIWQSMGPYGLLGLKLLTAALVVLLGYRTARMMGGQPWLTALLCVFVVLAGWFRFSERPELFSLINTALISFILFGCRATQLPRGVIWLIPLIMVMWNWLHGAVFGLGLLSLFIAGENIKYLFPKFRRETTDDHAVLSTFNLCYALTLLAMLIDPFGLRSYGIFFGYLNNKTMPGIIDFMWSTSFLRESLPIMFMLIWASLLAIRHIRSVDITEFILLIVFGAMAIRYFRMSGVTSIVLIPIIANLMGTTLQQTTARLSKTLVTGIMLLVAVFVAGYGYWIKFSDKAPSSITGNYPLFEDLYPVGSLRFVQTMGINGNYYNSGNLGGYLSFYAAPERKIFQYNMPLFIEAGNSIDSRKLALWNINYAFVAQEKELRYLFPINKWALVYRDPHVALVLRRTPQNQALILQYETARNLAGLL